MLDALNPDCQGNLELMATLRFRNAAELDVNAPFSNTLPLLSLTHYVLILYIKDTFKRKTNRYDHSAN